jgi:hypothetical protein
MQPDPRRRTNARHLHDSLREILVHCESAAEHATPDIRDATGLEQALYGPILTVGAVKHGEDNVETDLMVRDAEQTIWYRHFDRTTLGPKRLEIRVRKKPVSFAIDSYRDHAVASLFKGFEY